MEKEVVDLRDLIMMIKEKKEMDANLSLEFDCRIEVEDYKPLVKVINYAINYVSQLSSDTIQISLNAGIKGHMLVVTASTTETEFPPLNEQVPEALAAYNATIKQGGDPGKYVQILLNFVV